MAVNKVVINTANGEETLIDLTQDTVSAETLAEGVTAHDKSGEVIIGTMSVGENLDTVLTEQEELIAELQDVLKGKASGGGGMGELMFTLYNGTQTSLSNIMRIVVPDGGVKGILLGDETLWPDALPFEYQRVEYLESTGTQYINTGIVASNDTGISINYRYTQSGNAPICGVLQRVGERTDSFLVTSYNGQTSSTLLMAHSGALFSGDNITLNVDYHCKINYLNDGSFYLDGKRVGEVGQNGLINAPILIFARLNSQDNTKAVSKSRIYYVEFTEGDAVSHKFIPCRRKSDGKLGMYDSVSGAFFTNAGKGEFLTGGEA